MESRYFKYYRNSITGKVPDQVSYGVYWKPIVDEIGQAATVYLSADGIYNQINLEAIPAPDGRFVIDNANIVLVSNTKDIYTRKIRSRAVATSNTASMFGNPTFYLTASADSRIISPLPGTEKEVNQVQFILDQKGWTTTEYLDKSAAEEKIKELNSPKIFHIATHGFFQPRTEARSAFAATGINQARAFDNPLLRSGLLLTNAGDVLSNSSGLYQGEGVLTAYEAMNLNLDQTELVVLSACETGMGEVQVGEGVYGLQRAFQVAGARTVVMSLFKVNDEATQQLMSTFYRNWMQTGNKHQAFADAKRELRKTYPDPLFWSGFVMVGVE